MKTILSPLATFALLSLGIAVGSAPADEKKSPAPLKAVAVIHATEGNKVAGTVTFTEVADGVRVVAALTGLAPGQHGFHVHEFGDCSSADGSSAGGHFNPTHKKHGGPSDTERHAGDMGNLEADASGSAQVDYVDHDLSLVAGEHSIIGRAVIVHAKADDLKSQPSGEAGARIGCGVIGHARGE